MSDTTKIQWAEHTGGPFLGCTCVSPGCAKCYAKDLAESRLDRIFRTAYKMAGFEDWESRPVWGDNATRILTKGFWKDALRINAQHAKAGTRGRWFPSMIDWLDKMPGGIIDQDGKRLDPVAVLAHFFKLVHDTPHLDWLLLTKRPQNWESKLRAVWNFFKGESTMTNFIGDWLGGKAPSNVWIGASCEDQQRADERIPELLKIPAKVRFLSCEPLIGPINLKFRARSFGFPEHITSEGHAVGMPQGIHWVIIGGESGKGARPCDVYWIRSLVRQCNAAGVAQFVKQTGSHAVDGDELGDTGRPLLLSFDDPKGGDMAEWPEDMRVREFPV